MTMNDIKKLRKALGLTQKDVATHVGVSASAVTRWESGSLPKGQHLVLLSDILNTTPADLLPTRKECNGDKKRMSNKLVQSNLGVPLIKINSLRIGADGQLEYSLSEPDSVICPALKGSNSFAFTIISDDMSSSRGLAYPKGAIAYCDPDGSTPVWSLVVAILSRNEHVVFSQLVDHSGDNALKPLNERYPLITEPFKIIGRVFGVYITPKV